MKLVDAEARVKGTHPKWPAGALRNQVMTCIQTTASDTHSSPYQVLEDVLDEGLHLKDMFDSAVFWDWKEVAEEKVVDGFDILVIPKNTALFHGTNIDVFPEGAFAQDKSYFSDLRGASTYAFREAAYAGQLLVMATNAPLTIFRMTSKNIKLLKQRYPTDFPEKEFKYAYSYTSLDPRRVSHPMYDNPIQRWWCSQNIPFDGFGDTKYTGFHPELSLCKTTINGKPSIRRLPYRYRFDVDFWECIMLIDDNSGDIQPFPNEMITHHLKWGRGENPRSEDEFRVKQLDQYVDKPNTKYSSCTASKYGADIAENQAFRKRSEGVYLYPILPFF